MRILIISDIHGNKEAIEAINEDVDYVFFLGDVVNYGPDPHFAIDFIKTHGNYVVKGNHDQAVAYNANCKCSQSFRKIAEATKEFTIKTLPNEKMEYLRFLPVSEKIDLPGTDFFLVHALPSNPLYKYINPDDKEALREEAEYIRTGIIFLGHTHFQWQRKIGSTTFVSPGSVGMSKDTPGFANYAIWEDGNILLRKTSYDIDTTLSKVDKMPVASEIREEIKLAFRTGKTAG